jgi:hypothetical protein
MSEIDYTKDFAEVFEFARSERDDVRRMALEGLAQHSKDNVFLHRFLSTNDEVSTRAIESVLQLMNEKGIPHLGHVMTLLINTAADCSCAEALVSRGVVPRTMRLLDVLETTEAPAAAILREMALMLLNNLTATHVSAVSTLLQLDDEDLRGFYLSRLKLFFDRQPEGIQRDVRKWILQIGVNATRVPDGQVAVTDDEEWVQLLTELLESATENTLFATFAVQALQNCANNKRTHENLCKNKSVTKVMTLMLNKSLAVELQMGLAEILAGLMQSEVGMQQLEEHNIKKLLSGPPGGEGADPLHPDVRRFAEEHVLPFLDDIQDAFVMQGGDD